ncbi:MAG: cytidine deaminase [Clostridia bacterium]|nr:cytidine deaminase [Clostridia bacterium]
MLVQQEQLSNNIIYKDGSEIMIDNYGLIKMANEARKSSYSPYSNFKVGAAVLTSNGNIYTGCNVENASFGATNCAERTAIYKAVSEGEREIRAIAIVGDSQELTFPCGICRQVIFEFSNKDTLVIVAKSDGTYKIFNISELIPFSFSKKDIGH